MKEATVVELTREIQDALNAPFPEDEVEFLPKAHSNGKALGLAYIDARAVMRRLDAAVGAANWSFDFDVLDGAGKMVKGRLTVCGVTKCDAGEGSTEDEPLKSAVSDALKRTAVHFGVGRYLYYLPKVWAPYDNQRRTWAEQPRIAPAALEKALAMCGVSGRGIRPAPRPAAAPSPKEQKAEGGGARGGRETPSFTNRKGEPLNVHSAAELVCSTESCEKPLTKGQHDMSVRVFGDPLCPACQKERAKVEAAAAGARPAPGSRHGLTPADVRN